MQLDLTSQVRLRLTGADRVRYLNGQVTNDIRKISGDRILWAGVTNHKGKLEALVAIHEGPTEDILVDGPEALRDFLPLRLEKYIIADEVELTDVTETTCQFHCLGKCPELPPGCRKISAQRLGEPGWDVWGPMELRETLASLSPTLPAELAEQLRIERGIPGWETELARDILLPEAGLEAWTVDYHKGCYIGQEVISRMKSAGKVNRKLERLIAVDGARPEAGWLLFPQEGAGDGAKPCGEITSSIYHPKLEKVVALGYVRREHLGHGARFLTGPDANSLFARIEIRNP